MRRGLKIDVQFLSPHLQSMGAIEIPRGEYLDRLREAVAGSAMRESTI